MAEASGGSKRTKSASGGRKAADGPRRPRYLPSLKRARRWVGMRIDGLEGRTFGRVVSLLVDVEDGKPRWVVVRLGPIAGCTAIPYEHVAEGAGRLWAAYGRGWVREAPTFGPDEALAAGEEIDLCTHWGIREGRGRAAEVSGREDDEITAVPDGG